MGKERERGSLRGSAISMRSRDSSVPTLVLKSDMTHDMTRPPAAHSELQVPGSQSSESRVLARSRGSFIVLARSRVPFIVLARSRGRDAESFVAGLHYRGPSSRSIRVLHDALGAALPSRNVRVLHDAVVQVPRRLKPRKLRPSALVQQRARRDSEVRVELVELVGPDVQAGWRMG